MARLPKVKTPQFRSQLTKRLANFVPFVRARVRRVRPRHRLQDRRGRYRSNTVRIYRYNPRVLSATWLQAAVRRAGTPEAGLPRGV